MSYDDTVTFLTRKLLIVHEKKTQKNFDISKVYIMCIFV